MDVPPPRRRPEELPRKSTRRHAPAETSADGYYTRIDGRLVGPLDAARAASLPGVTKSTPFCSARNNPADPTKWRLADRFPALAEILAAPGRPTVNYSPFFTVPAAPSREAVTQALTPPPRPAAAEAPAAPATPAKTAEVVRPGPSAGRAAPRLPRWALAAVGVAVLVAGAWIGATKSMRDGGSRDPMARDFFESRLPPPR